MRYATDAYAADGIGWSTENPGVRVFSPGPDAPFSRTSEFTFHVRDLETFSTPTIVAHITGQAVETVFDGLAFTPLYAKSTKSTLAAEGTDQTAGYAFTIRRLGGWPASVRFEIPSLDSDGNEAIIGGGPVPEVGGG
jgi:hypothetical protein